MLIESQNDPTAYRAAARCEAIRLSTVTKSPDDRPAFRRSGTGRVLERRYVRSCEMSCNASKDRFCSLPRHPHERSRPDFGWTALALERCFHSRGIKGNAAPAGTRTPRWRSPGSPPASEGFSSWSDLNPCQSTWYGYRIHVREKAWKGCQKRCANTDPAS